MSVESSARRSPPGWYPDPWAGPRKQYRWWDGTDWSNDTYGVGQAGRSSTPKWVWAFSALSAVLVIPVGVVVVVYVVGALVMLLVWGFSTAP